MWLQSSSERWMTDIIIIVILLALLLNTTSPDQCHVRMFSAAAAAVAWVVGLQSGPRSELCAAARRWQCHRPVTPAASCRQVSHLDLWSPWPAAAAGQAESDLHWALVPPSLLHKTYIQIQIHTYIHTYTYISVTLIKFNIRIVKRLQIV